MADEVERDISTLQVSVFGAPAAAQILENYEQAGINRALLALPSEDRDSVLTILDQYQTLLS